MTNTERADAAMIALEWHAAEKDGKGTTDMTVPGVLEEEMTDLLADLEHLAMRENINFADVKERALRHVFEERAGR